MGSEHTPHIMVSEKHRTTLPSDHVMHCYACRDATTPAMLAAATSSLVQAPQKVSILYARTAPGATQPMPVGEVRSSEQQDSLCACNRAQEGACHVCHSVWCWHCYQVQSPCFPINSELSSSVYFTTHQ